MGWRERMQVVAPAFDQAHFCPVFESAVGAGAAAAAAADDDEVELLGGGGGGHEGCELGVERVRDTFDVQYLRGSSSSSGGGGGSSSSSRVMCRVQ